MRPHPQHVVRTVDLPSGKVLEVVCPEAGDPFTRVRPSPAEDRDLCACPACASELVEPLGWESAGPERWRVSLRCPNCAHTSEGVFSQECVDRFDTCLDEGTAAMVSDLKRLEMANMADDIERFVGALQAGAILPEDFKTPGTGIFSR
jgi:hypothetical protein